MPHTANNDIIESKGVLMALTEDIDRIVAQDNHVALVAFSISPPEWAVCDWSMTGSYFTYLFTDEGKARDAFRACVEQWPDQAEASAREGEE